MKQFTTLLSSRKIRLAFAIFIPLTIFSILYWPIFIKSIDINIPKSLHSNGSSIELYVDIDKLDLDNQSLNTTITQISIDRNNINESVFKKFCEEGIGAMHFEEQYDEKSWGGGPLSYDEKKICVDKSYIGEDIEIKSDVHHSRIEYPFDTVTLDIGFLIGFVEEVPYDIGFLPKSNKWYAPKVYWNFSIDGWNVREFQDINDGNISRIKLVIQRPSIYRIGIPLTLSSISFFILSMLLIKDISSLAQTSSSLLFGLVGIRQVIIAPDVRWFTQIDAIFLVLYTCLLLLSAIKIFFIYRKQ